MHLKCQKIFTSGIYHSWQFNLDNMQFQQDCATCHTFTNTLDLMRSIIFINGDVNWSTRSCDLTPFDFFLWGQMESQVYKDNPQTIPYLKAEIVEIIGEIEPHLCINVIQKFDTRVAICKAIYQIIFLTLTFIFNKNLNNDGRFSCFINQYKIASLIENPI